MTKRAGRTVKISISLDATDLAKLRRHAKRHSEGNLSAAVAAMIRLADEWEGRRALAEWLGEGRPEPSPEAQAEIRADWERPIKRTRRRSRAA